MSFDMSMRVIVTRPIVGLCHMQVCAVADATDEEILEVCNAENPAGTTHGWSQVCRDGEWMGSSVAPVECDQEPGRLHLLVAC